MALEPTQAIKIFFSYAHEDNKYRDEMEKHLGALKRSGKIVTWYDRDIQAGTQEAFFCYTVAGEQEASSALQKALFEEASSSQDWQHLDNLLHVQEEAEQLPFVQPLHPSEQQILLQGLIHRLQGKWEAAILDYTNALAIDPRSILAYVSRGTSYAGQNRFAEALVDYNTALRLDKEFAQAYPWPRYRLHEAKKVCRSTQRY